MKTLFKSSACIYIYLSNIRSGIQEFKVIAGLESSKEEIVNNINNLVNPILDMEFSEFINTPTEFVDSMLKDLSPFIIDFFRLVNGKTPEHICKLYENRIYKYTDYKGDVPIVIRNPDLEEDISNCIIKKENINNCRPTKLELIALQVCGQIVEIGLETGDYYIKYD